MTFVDLATYQQPPPVLGPLSRDMTPVVLHALGLDATPSEITQAMLARQALGRETYGRALHTHDRRDEIADPVTKALDLYQYLVRLSMVTRTDQRWIVQDCLEDTGRILRRLLTLHNLRGPVTARHDGDGDAG